MKQPRDKRRIIVTSEPNEVVTVPKLESLMTDALSIIGAELAHYRAKSKRGVTLDLKEARVIQSYMDALVKMSKEAREAARAEDLSDLTNEELLQLANEVTKRNRKREEPESADSSES